MPKAEGSEIFKLDTTIKLIIQGISIIPLILVFLIIIFLVQEASPIFKTVGLNHFFADNSWYPTEGKYNLLPMMLGTFWTTFGAILLAIPTGILSAIFCQFYAPQALAKIYRQLLTLLAGIPSVVYGFWGLVTIVPLINQIKSPGASLLAGILIGALMILPTVALIADASLSEVPNSYLNAAKALGISQWGIVSGVIIPAAKSGLVTAGILATGRALGETMAVLMVCGNVVKTPTSLFDPIRTLTANIALEMSYALGDHRAALFVSGLILMAMVITLLLAAEWFAEIGKIHG
jgi:phosphate transport system permease protein